jgi:hypothetical protein
MRLVSRSQSSPTTAANGASDSPVISADGRRIAFRSLATNLVAGQVDTNASTDIFLFDQVNESAAVVSALTDSSTTGNLVSDLPSISASGHAVAFRTTSTNFTSGDYNSATDVYLLVDSSPPTEMAFELAQLNENAEVGTAVGIFTTTDGDAGDTHTYSLVAGDGDNDSCPVRLRSSVFLQHSRSYYRFPGLFVRNERRYSR